MGDTRGFDKSFILADKMASTPYTHLVFATGPTDNKDTPNRDTPSGGPHQVNVINFPSGPTTLSLASVGDTGGLHACRIRFV